MPYLAFRDASTPEGVTPTMHTLLIALVILGSVAFSLCLCLYAVRHVRKRRARQRVLADLPLHHSRNHTRSSNNRSLTISTNARESVFVLQEKANLMANSDSPPTSPIPEIRITFPEELDEKGKAQSGRVVVVRVGDKTVGFEPVGSNLPPYQRHESERFHSLDLDRIGGLKEKEFK